VLLAPDERRDLRDTREVGGEEAADHPRTGNADAPHFDHNRSLELAPAHQA
jgi:hypothetical protein